MADFRRYQPRRSSSSLPWRRLGFFGVLIIIVILVARSIFSGGDSSSTNNDQANTIRLVTDNTNAADTNVNADSNPSDEANTNTTASISPDASGFSLEPCTGPISQFGQAKAMALTFNLAADNEQTRDLLEVLKKSRTPASWFVSGNLAETSTALVGDLAAAGHGVYNRTYDNPRLTELSIEQTTEQLAKAETAISAATGRSSKPFLRPPFGEVDATVAEAAKAQGYCTILWTVDAFDWQSEATAASSSQRVIDKFRSGAIIMFSAGYDITARAVERVIEAAKADDYELKSLIELIKN